MANLKIGDRVRFLDSVGGGIVRRFKSKDIVMVEDEDGFEIPTLIGECVVVTDEEDARQSGRPRNAANTIPPKPTTPSFASLGKKGTGDSAAAIGDAPGVKSIRDARAGIDFRTNNDTFERKDGEILDLSLAFIPADDRRLQSTDFHCYLINDSNYWVFFTLLSAQGVEKSEEVMCRYTGLVEPNTKIKLFAIGRSEVDMLEQMAVQLIAFKREKMFKQQSPMHIDVRLNTSRFFKLHAFIENDFFEQNALMQPLVRAGRPYLPMKLDEEAISRGIREKVQAQKNEKQEKEEKSNSVGTRKNAIIEVDLHIQSLLDSTAGMSAGDILLHQMDVFRKAMQENLNTPGTKIVFIHGKGDGVLRRNIIDELKKRYAQCQWQDASFREYGFGATQVTIRKR